MSWKWMWVAMSLFLLVTSFAYYPKWEKVGGEAQISYDILGYYAYLPATFIYKDLKDQKFESEISQKYGTGYWVQVRPEGFRVLQYTNGMAVMYAIPFGVAHVLAEPLGYPADGYSKPYPFALQAWGYLWSVLGLFLLGTILYRFYSNTVTSIVLLSLVMGTHYLEYAALSNAYTHTYLFTLQCMVILFSLKIAVQARTRYFIGLGIALGLMALIRPTELINVLLPFIFIHAASANHKDYIAFLKQQVGRILLTMVIMIAIGSLQLFYWKYVSGSWIVYSYGDQGFSWLSPHFYDGLFSARKGWLVYTPMMLLAIWGWFYFRRDATKLRYSLKLAIPLGLYALLVLYITFAWDIWWYGGGLGQRAIIQSYPIWLLFMGAFWQRAFTWKTGARIALAAIVGFIIYYNLWIHHQAHRGGILDTEHTNRAYFWHTFLKYDIPTEHKALKNNSHQVFYPTPADAVVLYEEDFEGLWGDQAAVHTMMDPMDTMNHAMRLKDSLWVDLIDIQTTEIKHRIRLELVVGTEPKVYDYWRTSVLYGDWLYNGKPVKQKHLRIDPIIETPRAQAFHFDLKKPNALTDSLKIYLYTGDHAGKVLWIDDLKLSTW